MPSARHFGLVVLSLALSRSATAQETGDVCVRNYRPTAICGADDVRLEAIIPLAILEGCDENVPGEVELDMNIVLQGNPERYDIGLFIAQDGGDAREAGSCFHDYLPPPLVPAPIYGDSNSNGIPDVTNGGWWDGGPDADQCGDVEAGTEIIKTLVPIRFKCVDTNGDGAVDVGVCTSWANSANPSCHSVGDATAETDNSCNCRRVETGISLPSAHPVPTFDARPRAVLVGLLMLSTLALAARSRRPA